MNKFADWSGSAKAFVLAIVFLILAIGLCSVGSGLEEHNTTALQDFEAQAGLFCFAGFCISGLTGVILAIARSMRGGGPPKR